MRKLSKKSELGTLLKQWRGVRGRSQLDISVDTGISQRQISFIESGRSVPSRVTLMGIAQALEIPLRERNVLLLAAGYAPVYSDAAWNSDEMKSISKALERMLAQHEPYPAVVMDRYWNVLMTNEGAPRFFNCFIDLSARPAPRNMLHLMFDPTGMRPFIADWEALAKALIQRVYQETVGHVTDDKTRELVGDLLAYPQVPTVWKELQMPTALPMIPMSFVKEGMTMNYFSLVTTVGTPQTIAAQELRVECLYPADDGTEALHAKVLAGCLLTEALACTTRIVNDLNWLENLRCARRSRQARRRCAGAPITSCYLRLRSSLGALTTLPLLVLILIHLAPALLTRAALGAVLSFAILMLCMLLPLASLVLATLALLTALVLTTLALVGHKNLASRCLRLQNTAFATSGLSETGRGSVSVG